MSARLFYVRTHGDTGDLVTASGRILESGVSLDAAGEAYLGETITLCG